MNFVFCEWELYDGTAPKQKAKNANFRINIEFMRKLNVDLKRVDVGIDPYDDM